MVHDYIQWIFPLPERSGASPWAPVLDAATIAAIRNDAEMQGRLRAAFERMLAFYGFALEGDAVVEGPRFVAASRNWLHAGNHNHLRLTRMLRSLRVLGLERARLLHCGRRCVRCMSAIVRRGGGRLPRRHLHSGGRRLRSRWIARAALAPCSKYRSFASLMASWT
jgi:hypothetical protein